MAYDYTNDKLSTFVFMPLVGETLSIHIKELKSVTDKNTRFHFKKKDVDDLGTVTEKDLGYHLEATLYDNDKTLMVTSLSQYIQVFKKNELNDNDIVRIEHVGKGEWKVEKILNHATQT